MISMEVSIDDYIYFSWFHTPGPQFLHELACLADKFDVIAASRLISESRINEQAFVARTDKQAVQRQCYLPGALIWISIPCEEESSVIYKSARADEHYLCVSDTPLHANLLPVIRASTATTPRSAPQLITGLRSICSISSSSS